MATVFFTGFPGFLGVELLPRVLERRPDAQAVCLVQSKFAAQAADCLASIVTAHPALDGRIRLVEGDIVRAGLGLAEAAAVQADTVEIFHLAAVYDLSVGRDLAMRVNVEGTRHVLDFAAGCPRLHRFQYVSTCYVSGAYPGIFSEDDLVKGQRFNNFYEETKYLAEVEVQARMRDGLPATIYRPSVVVGDSQTGATQKYDGPYFFIRYLLKQPGIALMPVIGDPSQYRLNVVPRDVVVEAIAYLSGQESASGKVFALADPHPPTVEETVEAIGSATGKTIVRVPLTKEVAKFTLGHIPGVADWMGVPASTVDYFVHPTHYTTTNTDAALAGTGIRVPRFGEYVDRMVDFVRAHPEIGSKAMV